MSRISLLIAAGLWGLFLLPPAFAADPAVARVQSFYDVLTDTMKQGAALGPQGRFNKLAPAIDSSFNLPAMTAYTVGPSWASTSPADQKALIDAFRRFTIANYVSNFKSDDGITFKVSPDVKTYGTDEVVQSELDPKSGEPVALNYRMRQDSGSWKILDVYSAGFVSELARRRSDFSSILTTGGPQALVKKLNEMSDGMLKGS